MIRDKIGIKSQIDFFDECVTPESVTLIKEIKSTEDNVGNDKLSFAVRNKNVYGFNNFKKLEKLIKDISSKSMAKDKAKTKQNKFARGSK